MSILSDAWRRARGEDDAVTRALGAPPARPGARRVHWLPWLLCCLLLIVVVGLSVYLWRSNWLTRTNARSGTAAVVNAPVQLPASPEQAGKKPASGSQASHGAATPARADVTTSPVSVKAASRAASAARVTGGVAVPGTVPESVRAQLPALAVTVHVWNPHPASRFIVVNGHIYHEGDELPQGLRLVSITQDGEIVNFQGYLITLNGH